MFFIRADFYLDAILSGGKFIGRISIWSDFYMGGTIFGRNSAGPNFMGASLHGRTFNGTHIKEFTSIEPTILDTLLNSSNFFDVYENKFEDLLQVSLKYTYCDKLSFIL